MIALIAAVVVHMPEFHNMYEGQAEVHKGRESAVQSTMACAMGIAVSVCFNAVNQAR